MFLSLAAATRSLHEEGEDIDEVKILFNDENLEEPNETTY